MRARLFAASLTCVSLAVTPSFAQDGGAPVAAPQAAPASADDVAEVSEEARDEAARLLLEGRKQMSNPKQLDLACETLSKSYALHRRGDTLLNLAECHRRQGKTATAWREFDEAIRYAEAVEFKEAIEAAMRLRDELATKLSGLEVRVPEPVPAELIVVLDGKVLPRQQWGQPLYVDPGVHEVAATARGYEGFAKSVTVQREGARTSIEVRLEKEPEPEKPKPAPPPEPPAKPEPPAPERGGPPGWAFVVGGAGVAMLGVSAAFGALTLDAGGSLDDTCGEGRASCPPGYDFEGERGSELLGFGMFVGFGAAGIVATGVGVAGLIAHAVGGPSHERPAVAVMPLLGPGFAGATLGGTF